MEQFGEGHFRLGNIKQITTTSDFETLTEESRECQLESSFEDCVTEKYLEALKEECRCMPFNLQNYSYSVEEFDLCINEKQWLCVAKIQIPKDMCNNPCKGLYVDVKKDPVEIIQAPQYQMMVNQYKMYTWMQNHVDTKTAGLRGKFRFELLFLHEESGDTS